MVLFLFLFWILLNGRFSADAGMLQICITGIILAAAITLFAKKFLGYKISSELAFWKKLPLLIAYAALLVKEIVISSLNMLTVVIKKKPYNPVIVKFNPPLKSELARVILANSITLTPGTITAELTEEGFTVHCIDDSFAENIECSSFVKLLERIENK